MKQLILGALASVALSTAVLIAPAVAAPMPSAAGSLVTDNGAIINVQMMRGERMMMRKKMMMRQRMMMREKMMMRRKMMKRKMMRGM